MGNCASVPQLPNGFSSPTVLELSGPAASSCCIPADRPSVMPVSSSPVVAVNAPAAEPPQAPAAPAPAHVMPPATLATASGFRRHNGTILAKAVSPHVAKASDDGSRVTEKPVVRIPYALTDEGFGKGAVSVLESVQLLVPALFDSVSAHILVGADQPQWFCKQEGEVGVYMFHFLHQRDRDTVAEWLSTKLGLDGAGRIERLSALVPATGMCANRCTGRSFSTQCRCAWVRLSFKVPVTKCVWDASEAQSGYLWESLSRFDKDVRGTLPLSAPATFEARNHVIKAGTLLDDFLVLQELTKVFRLFSVLQARGVVVEDTYCSYFLVLWTLKRIEAAEAVWFVRQNGLPEPDLKWSKFVLFNTTSFQFFKEVKEWFSRVSIGDLQKPEVVVDSSACSNPDSMNVLTCEKESFVTPFVISFEIQEECFGHVAKKFCLLIGV